MFLLFVLYCLSRIQLYSSLFRFFRYAVGFCERQGDSGESFPVSSLYVKFLVSCMVGSCRKTEVIEDDESLCKVIVNFLNDLDVVSNSIDKTAKWGFLENHLREFIPFWNLCQDLKIIGIL